jgi:hypothetical protein
MMTDYYVLSRSSLIYSIDNLDDDALIKFIDFIKDKRDSGWTNEMIEVHLVTNIAAEIKKQYTKLTKQQRISIAEEMIYNMLQSIFDRKLLVAS